MVGVGKIGQESGVCSEGGLTTRGELRNAGEKAGEFVGGRVEPPPTTPPHHGKDKVFP